MFIYFPKKPGKAAAAALSVVGVPLLCSDLVRKFQAVDGDAFACAGITRVGAAAYRRMGGAC